MDPKIRHAIAEIDEDVWTRTAIEYPNAVFDQTSGQWISDAEIADVGYTSTPTHATHGRLIVRRVRDPVRGAAHTRRHPAASAHHSTI